MRGNSFKPELASAINRKAHMLAAQSFASIRVSLEELARSMLKHGSALEEVLAAIRCAGVPQETPERGFLRNTPVHMGAREERWKRITMRVHVHARGIPDSTRGCPRARES